MHVRNRVYENHCLNVWQSFVYSLTKNTSLMTQTQHCNGVVTKSMTLHVGSLYDFKDIACEVMVVPQWHNM